MTDLIPMISAAALMLGIAVAFVVFLIVGITYALGWYLWELWGRAFGDEGRAG